MAINSNYMLPYFVRSIPQMSDLLQAEQQEIDLLQELISSTHDELYINTCFDLITRYEQLFNIEYSQFLTIEEKRQNIIIKLNARTNTTIQALKDLIFTLLSCEADIKEYYNDYYFLIQIYFTHDSKTGNIYKLINQVDIIKPAHLNYNLLVKLDPFTQTNKNNINLYKFIFKICVNNWGFTNNIIFDGSYTFDGYNTFNHQFKANYMHKFIACFSIKNSNINTHTINYYHKFDGATNFDSKYLFNSQAK